MKAIYAFGLLILITFLGSQFLFKRKKILSPLNFFFLSGLVYIFLGYLMGEEVLNILNQEVLRGLNPIISLGLGWIGFIFGFQLESKYIRRFPGKYLGFSFLQFVIVFIIALVVFYFLLSVILNESSRNLILGMSIAFGLLITLNSATLLNAASFTLEKKGSLFYLARFVVSVSGFWGILGLAFLSGFWHFPFVGEKIFLNGFVFLFISIIFPIGLGFIFHFLTKSRNEEQEIMVYLMGMVFFVSGGAFYFNLPPLFVSMILGITYANLTRKQEHLYPVLLSTEKPLYIILLILIGALWKIEVSLNMVLLVLVLIGIRILVYTIPIPFLQRILRFPEKLCPVFGLCFLSSGGIGIAFAFSLKLIYQLSLTDIFLSSALISIILSEIISPWALKKSFKIMGQRERA
jgi:Kef-type K+ transport system membrane component KefB